MSITWKRSAWDASQSGVKRPTEVATAETGRTTWWRMHDGGVGCFGPPRTTRGARVVWHGPGPLCHVRQRTDCWMACRLGWVAIALPFAIQQFNGVFRGRNTTVWSTQWFIVALAAAMFRWLPGVKATAGAVRIAFALLCPTTIFTMGLP